MTPETLASLPQRQRLSAVVRLARSASTDPTAATAFEALAVHPDAWFRWFAALGYSAMGRADRLVTLTDDPSRRVRRSAWNGLARTAPGPHLCELLTGIADRRSGSKVAAVALRHRRLPEIEALVVANARTSPHWADVLPFCQEATLTPLLGPLEEWGGDITWARLARHHPGLVAGHLVSRVPPGRPVDSRLARRLHTLLPILAGQAPDAALDLVEALFGVEGQAAPIRASLQRLATLRPERTFDLLRSRQAKGLPAPLSGLFSLITFPKAERLGAERLSWAVRHAPACLPVGSEGRRWFQRLSEGDRSKVLAVWMFQPTHPGLTFLFGFVPAGAARDNAFARWRTGNQNSDGVIATAKLQELPWELRTAEARRHLTEVVWLQSRPIERRMYAALLPWSEAEAALSPWLGHPEGSERSVAWTILLGALRHDREAGDLAVRAIRRRKNEQDPVRMAMLNGLGTWARSRVPDGAVPEMAAIVDDALDAADLSHGTSRAAQLVAAAVFARAPERGEALFLRILKVRGSLDGHAIGGVLRNEDAARLDPTFAAVVERWCQSDRAIAVLGVLFGLDVRLRHMPRTRAVAAGLVSGSPHLPVLAALLHTLRRHDRAGFAQAVLALFTLDPSAACLPEVATFLATVRNDLLDPLLEERPMKGRFASGRTHWVLDFGFQLHALHPGQQRAYAAGLLNLLDPDRDVPTASWAISRLLCLPDLPPSTLLGFIEDPRPAVRDIVIRAVPWLDQGDTLTALMDCMGDDRARVASYALRKVLDELGQAETMRVLARVPLQRVTVAKEVMRLMGERGGIEARDHLIAVGAGPLHRDVRIALLRALWDHIEHPPAFALLEAAASDPDPILVQRLLSIPMSRLSEAADTRLCALFAKVLSRKEPEARLGFLAQVGQAPLRDQQRGLLQALVSHIGTADPAEAASALGAVLDRFYPGEVERVAEGVLKQRSRLRRFDALVNRLAQALHPWSPEHHRALGRKVLAGVSGDPLFSCHALALTTRVEPTAAVATLLLAQASAGHLHHDLVEQAKAVPVSSPDELYRLLLAAPDPRLRRVALAALVRAAGGTRGWTAERREALTTLQADPSVEVSVPARWVFPP